MKLSPEDRNRAAKAAALAAGLHRLGYTAEQVIGLDDDQRAHLVAATPYGTCSDRTWSAVIGIMGTIEGTPEGGRRPIVDDLGGTIRREDMDADDRWYAMYDGLVT